MSKRSTSESVPKTMQARYDEITAMTDDFCAAHLNDEAAQICRRMAATLARKRPSPLSSGNPDTWAAGILHAVATVNFFFDKDDDLHIDHDDLAESFGRAKSTIGNKSRQIRDLLGIGFMDPDWTLPTRMDSNMMAWMISVDGMIVDARYLPLELQEIAYQKGLIPYVPGREV